MFRHDCAKWKIILTFVEALKCLELFSVWFKQKRNAPETPRWHCEEFYITTGKGDIALTSLGIRSCRSRISKQAPVGTCLRRPIIITVTKNKIISLPQSPQHPPSQHASMRHDLLILPRWVSEAPYGYANMLISLLGPMSGLVTARSDTEGWALPTDIQILALEGSAIKAHIGMLSEDAQLA